MLTIACGVLGELLPKLLDFPPLVNPSRLNNLTDSLCLVFCKSGICEREFALDNTVKWLDV